MTEELKHIETLPQSVKDAYIKALETEKSYLMDAIKLSQNRCVKLDEEIALLKGNTPQKPQLVHIVANTKDRTTIDWKNYIVGLLRKVQKPLATNEIYDYWITENKSDKPRKLLISNISGALYRDGLIKNSKMKIIKWKPSEKYYILAEWLEWYINDVDYKLKNEFEHIIKAS
jgi:hypothetical protein